MFNLFISGDCNAWEKTRYTLEITRCIRKGEYTNEELASKFGQLDENAIAQLRSFPCLFAYEDTCGQPPKFGWLRSIKKRTNQVILECEYVPIEPWISENDLSSIQASLDISRWELSRTHWAVKDVDLAEELTQLGISIPVLLTGQMAPVNPEDHHFEVAFSFPGEARQLVEKVLHELEKRLNPNDIFYDNYYKAFLARPNLDLLLSKIYHEQARLIVVFLSGDYDRKQWPGLEFRSVRQIIFEKQHHKVMYIRVDDSPVEGVLKTDGYIDALIHSPKEIASFIYQRVQAHKLINEKKA